MANLKLILSLGVADFHTGISQAKNFPNPGIWMYDSIGISPYGSSALDGRVEGLLSGTADSANISSTVDTATCGVTRVTGAGAGKLYMLGDAGHFYNYTLQSGTAPTDLRSGTPVTTPANGIAIFKPQGGTEYLFYWQTTQIGRWDLAGTYATGWTDNHFTSLQSTTFHPVHPFAGDVYYGNKDRIGKIYDNAGTAANNTNVLDFPSDFINLCLEDDGTYLIAAITKNQGDDSLIADTRIIFWDTFSPSWNREYSIPEPSINALKRKGNKIYAFGPTRVYEFDFYQAPVRVLKPEYGMRYGYANAITIWEDALLWGERQGSTIASYGSALEGLGTAYFRPYWTSQASQLQYLFLDMVGSYGSAFILAAGNNKLVAFNVNTLGSHSGIAETIYFDLGGEYKIKRADLISNRRIDSQFSFSLEFSMTVDETNSAGWVTTITDATGLNDKGHTYRLHEDTSPSGPGALYASALSLKLLFTSGIVGIKRINVYGEPTNR